MVSPTVRLSLPMFLPPASMTMAHADYDYITGPTRIVYDAFNITKSNDVLGLYKFGAGISYFNES